MPIAQHKLEGLGVVISLLGIHIDTKEGVLRLPAEKLSHLRGLITEWKGHKCFLKRELLSLIGQLQHTCKVVSSGRTFLRRMIDLSTVASELHHRIRLNWRSGRTSSGGTFIWRTGMERQCSQVLLGPHQ